MQGRNAFAPVLAVAVALLLVASTGAAASPVEPAEQFEAAGEFHPPDRTHGIEVDEHLRLWSMSEIEADGTTAGLVAGGSDHVYTEPPEQVATWNHAEHQRFTSGSTPPDDVATVDEAFVQDAYVALFAVEPSTLVHESEDSKELYVPPDGEVLAVVDYRGPDDASISTSLVETGDSAAGHTPSIDYEGLRGDTLTLEAEITKDDDSVNVTREYNVTVYDVESPPPISLTGYLPDGDTALFVHRNGPWSRVSFADDSEVYTSWRFFSSRNPAWDDGDVHPLQTHAYPSRRGVLRYPSDTAPDVDRTIGPDVTPPTLPDGVNVDVAEASYRMIYGLDLRTSEAATPRVHGVVRGSATSPRTVPEAETVYETNLELEVLEKTEDTVVVSVYLEDETGSPVDTRLTDAKVRVHDEEVDTDSSGAATVETSRPEGVLHAEYTPEDWTEARPPHFGDTASVSVEADLSAPETIDAFVGFAALIAPLLVVVYMLDRMLNLGVWPPWRRI